MEESEVQRDRELLKTLGLTVAEIALVCDAFRNQEMPSHGMFMSIGSDLSHTDTRGRVWSVDTRSLAGRLSRAELPARQALSRAIARFWKNYPAIEPGPAMRAAGFLD